MNIKHRIHSRRLCFQYIYMVLSDSNNIWINTIDYLKSDIYTENNITDFDDEYINIIINELNNNKDIYVSQVEELVNNQTTWFWREDMDNIKKTAFLLWYLEKKLLDTPPIVIINETVEVTKLFGDPQAAKLVNGILHKIVSEQ